MAGFVALSELQNQQRPDRRLDKTYGKKKGPAAISRAAHFDLFGGGNENTTVDEMDEKLTGEGDRETAILPIQETPLPPPTNTSLTEHDPRLRGRRKITSSRKMAASDQPTLEKDQIQALKPLLSLIHREVQDFQEFGKSMGKKYVCRKIGEGAFADVFDLEPKESQVAEEVYQRGGLVIKVIPFDIGQTALDDIVNLEAVAREVRVLMALDQLHGFARCRGVHVVKGGYPDVFTESFQTFKRFNPNEALNEDPRKNPPLDQLYIIIEMEDAGTPVWKVENPSAFLVFDVFWKLVMILANAEQKIEFEHRDLHHGNICLKPLQPDGPEDIGQEVIENMTEEPQVILGLSNVQVTIIDYTLARAKISDDAGNEVVVFDRITFWEHNDTKGETAKDKEQFKTYRKVRDWAKAVDSRARAMATLEGVEYEEVDKYSRFLPKSNVLWLGYLLGRLLERPGGARGAIRPGSSRAAKRLQLGMWGTLEEVLVEINGASPTLIPESAEDLLATAVAKKWLAPADMAAFRAQLED